MLSPLCRHCRKAPISRPRQLCWGCYYTPAIRDRYPPSGGKYARRGLGLGYRRPTLPPFPTTALPGSPEKIAILQQRASQGFALWHPDDAPLDYRRRPRRRALRVG